MRFQQLKDFQNQLSAIGIGGNDLALYLNGQQVYRLLAGRTVDLMRTNTLSPDALEDLWHSGPGRNGYGYGLGVRTMHAPDVAGSPSPAGEFGWGGAWGTYVIMDPTNQFTLVFAVQTSCADNAYFQLRLRNMAYAALEYEGLL